MNKSHAIVYRVRGLFGIVSPLFKLRVSAPVTAIPKFRSEWESWKVKWNFRWKSACYNLMTITFATCSISYHLLGIAKLTNKQAIKARLILNQVGLLILVFYWAIEGEDADYSILIFFSVLFFMICVYLERCLNCGNLAWLRRDKLFVISMSIGPLIMKDSCPHCGAHDYIPHSKSN